MTAPALQAADNAKPTIFYVDANCRLRRDLRVSELTDVIRDKSGHLWVDLRLGQRDQIAMLDNVFHFHPLAVEDALNPVSRVKVEEYNGFMLAIVRGVRFNERTDDPYDLDTFNITFYLG